MAEIVGFGPASEYLELKRNTLTAYVSRGTGPQPREYRIQDGYAMPVYDTEDLDEWRDNRPGQGARTDLGKAQA
jgi:hypothetical protein